MILVPVSTDAPVYHRPIGTISLITINVLVYLVTGSRLDEAIELFGLQHGMGFTPIQWVTSNFIHGGFFHVLGNMIFLWGFGLIVEGKIGSLQFVPLYLAIGVLQCFTEQIIFSDAVGVSFGASAIIFGLMVISLIWAPSNELSVFYWAFIRFWGVFDISVVGFALLNLFISFTMMLMYSALEVQLNSEVLHLMGGAIGGVFAVIYLKTKMVDCEGWDIFSVMSGNTPNSEQYLSHSFQEARKRRANTQKAERQRPFEREETANLRKPSPERFSNLISKKKPTAALAEFKKIRHHKPNWKPTPEELLVLARGLRTASMMNDAIAIYTEFIEDKPDFTLACLELAEIYVYVKDRPSAAMRLLEKCVLEQFNDKQNNRHQQATHHAQSMINDGVIEIKVEN